MRSCCSNRGPEGSPGLDALAHIHPAATDATLAQISHDGSSVTIDDATLAVPRQRQAAVARLRTCRRLAGVLDHEPVAGIFDGTPR